MAASVALIRDFLPRIKRSPPGSLKNSRVRPDPGAIRLGRGRRRREDRTGGRTKAASLESDRLE